MCVINEGAKMPISERLGERVAQGVQKTAKIVIGHVGNEESSTVDNDVQFETTPAEVGFIIS